MSSFNLLRKWRRAWLPITAIVGFMLIYALTVGGIAIIARTGYPALLPTPQRDAAPTHRASFIWDASHSTILPGLLYFYRFFPINTLVVSLIPPASANDMVKAEITELEMEFSDGRKEIFASAEKPLIKSVNGNTVQFELKTMELNRANITIQGKGFFESSSGEKIVFHIFQNMKYRSKLKFHPRHSLKNSPILQSF